MDRSRPRSVCRRDSCAKQSSNRADGRQRRRHRGRCRACAADNFPQKPGAHAAPSDRGVLRGPAPRAHAAMGMAFVFDPAEAKVGVVAGAPARAKFEPPVGGSVVRVWQLPAGGGVLTEPMSHLDRTLRQALGTRTQERGAGGKMPPPRTWTPRSLSSSHTFGQARRLCSRRSRIPGPTSKSFHGPMRSPQAHGQPRCRSATCFRQRFSLPARGAVGTGAHFRRACWTPPTTSSPASLRLPGRSRSSGLWRGACALATPGRSTPSAARRRGEWSNGDFAAAVVDSAIAVEIMLDAALAGALWEYGATPQEAGPTLSRPLVDRVKTQMHPRFGRSWDLTATPALRACQHAPGAHGVCCSSSSCSARRRPTSVLPPPRCGRPERCPPTPASTPTAAPSRAGCRTSRSP